MSEEEIISIKVLLKKEEGKEKLRMKSLVKEGYEGIFEGFKGFVQEYLASKGKRVKGEESEIGYDVYLIKGEGLFYAYDVFHRERPLDVAMELIQKFKDYPDFPLAENQLEEVRFEPHSAILDKEKLRIEQTPDGMQEAIEQDAYYIMKVPRKFDLDIREIEEMIASLDISGMGKYSKWKTLEVHHLGYNYY